MSPTLTTEQNRRRPAFRQCFVSGGLATLTKQADRLRRQAAVKRLRRRLSFATVLSG
jgi:hypothetical protein